MGGICGKTSDPGGVAVEAMSRAMAARRPLEPLGASEDGRVQVALDGEIFNQPYLAQTMRERGHVLATDSGAEILAHLYEEYGAALVHALEGSFAFAIWDGDGILLGRDRCGERPLFWADLGGQLAFASELTALAAIGLDELDPSAVDEYFAHGYVPEPASMLAGARQLPPGQTMRWFPGRDATFERYWQRPAAVEEATENVEDLVSELGRLLGEAIGARLSAGGPAGVLLDGDNHAVVAALAAQGSAAPITTLTVGFAGMPSGDLEAARAIAGALGSEHHEVVLPVVDAAAQVPALLAALDQPLGSRALVSLHLRSAWLREEVGVALAGYGAAELFGGRPDSLADGVLPMFDQAGVLSSLRYRTPFLDFRVAEFAATVPAAIHTEGQGERMLHDLAARLLPARLPALKRSPGPAERDGDEWLRGPLAPHLRDQVERGCLVEEGWIDRATAASQLEQHLSGGGDHGDALWRLLAFGLWLDRLRGRDA